MTQVAPDRIDGTALTFDTAPAEPGDHDRFAHYVKASLLADAMIFGRPLKALCGKEWVPTRDGLKFPVCPECKEIYESKEDDING